eukprot:2045993-Amphidinium_carterae.2
MASLQQQHAIVQCRCDMPRLLQTVSAGLKTLTGLWSVQAVVRSHSQPEHVRPPQFGYSEEQGNVTQEIPTMQLPSSTGRQCLPL